LLALALSIVFSVHVERAGLTSPARLRLRLATARHFQIFPIFTNQATSPFSRLEIPLQSSKIAGKLLPAAVAVAGRSR